MFGLGFTVRIHFMVNQGLDFYVLRKYFPGESHQVGAKNKSAISTNQSVREYLCQPVKRKKERDEPGTAVIAP
jgi:hypothetical protein